MAAVQRVLRVFYRDYRNDVAINSTEPESLLQDRLVSLAEHLLQSADNFLGVVDRDDAILQCYLSDEPDTVVLELVRPERPGCWRSLLPRDEALNRLNDLPARFDDALLPDAQYVD